MAYVSSPWLGVGVLFAFSLIARKLQGSWLAPSVFVGNAWSFFMALPLSLNEDHISAGAVWVVVALVFSFQTGAILLEIPSRHGHVGKTLSPQTVRQLHQTCLKLSLVFGAIAVIGAFFYVGMWFRRLGLASSFEGFTSLGSQMYSILLEGENDPWWFRLLRMWIFPSALLGGFAAASTDKWPRKLMALFVFVPALLIGVAIASRYGTTLAVACWVSGYCGMKCFLTAGRYKFKRRVVGIAILAVGALVVMYVGLGIVRGHKYLDDEAEIGVMVRGNLLGYLSVFDSYIQSREPRKLTWGTNTFSGLLEVVGAGERARALDYEEVILESGVYSNVYTAFRGLIQDFSIVGALLLALVSGMVAGAGFTYACSGKSSAVWILAACYVFVLWSPIVSAFNYNAVLLAVIVGAITLRRYEDFVVSVSGSSGATVLLSES